MRRPRLWLAALVLLSLCRGVAAQEHAIGVLAKRGDARTLNKWKATAAYLSARVPGERFVILPLGFDEIHRAVSQLEVDFILANPAFYVELEAMYGISRIATLKNRIAPGQAHHQFGGVLFTRAGSAVHSLDDLRGRRFAAVHERSFGGWHMAWRELRRHGIDPAADFAALDFAGTHDAAVYAVRDGRADAGTVRSDTLERMVEEGKINLADFRILNPYSAEDFPLRLSTPLYPEWPFARAAHVTDDLSQQVALALLQMPPDAPAARAARSYGWTIPLNYQPVHECLRELGIGPYRTAARFSLGDVLLRYRSWLLAIGLFLLLAAAGTFYVLKLNRRLQLRQIEIDALNRDLEQRVEARTREIRDLLEDSFRHHMCIERSQEEKIRIYQEEKLRNYETSLLAMIEMIEKRDTYTAGHTRRVAAYSLLIGKRMGYDRENLDKLKRAAILHDIGKIATPDTVLLKPGKLSPLEYDLIKQHVTAGYELLSKIDIYREFAEIMLHHHECYDGSGYPDGLQGEEIPPLARIISVADAFDAMTSIRIYKPRREIPDAFSELRRMSGKQFDPEVVAAAVEVLQGVETPENADQIPKTELEQERFAYFFNDQLTGIYNSEYLQFLMRTGAIRGYPYIWILYLTDFTAFNHACGWREGDRVLIEFATCLQRLYPDSLSFRVQGDDFILLSRTPLQLETEALYQACPRNPEVGLQITQVEPVCEGGPGLDKLELFER